MGRVEQRAMACSRQLRRQPYQPAIDHGTILNTSPQSSANDDCLSSKDVVVRSL